MKLIGWMLAGALVMGMTTVVFAAPARKGYKGRSAGSHHRLVTRNVSLPPPYVGPTTPAYAVPGGFANSFRYGPFGADRAPITGGGY